MFQSTDRTKPRETNIKDDDASEMFHLLLIGIEVDV